MTLADQFRTQLQTATGSVHQQLLLHDGPRTLRCQLDRCDPLAVTLYQLRLEAPQLKQATLPALQQCSRDLASRINYLLEPIAPIETDAQGCVVQMRSSPPQVDDNGRRYYELLVGRDGSIEIGRYEKAPGAARTRIPAVLTHEVAVRLTADFNASVDSLP